MFINWYIGIEKSVENCWKMQWNVENKQETVVGGRVKFVPLYAFIEGKGVDEWKEAGGRSIASRSSYMSIVLGWKLLLLTLLLLFLCFFFLFIVNIIKIVGGRRRIVVLVNTLRWVKIQKPFQIAQYLYKYLPIKQNKSILKHKWM